MSRYQQQHFNVDDHAVEVGAGDILRIFVGTRALYSDVGATSLITVTVAGHRCGDDPCGDLTLYWSSSSCGNSEEGTDDFLQALRLAQAIRQALQRRGTDAKTVTAVLLALSLVWPGEGGVS